MTTSIRAGLSIVRPSLERRATGGDGGPLFPPGGYCAECAAPECRCRVCHGAGWLRQFWEAGGPVPPMVACSCGARRQQLAAGAASSSVLGDYAASTFATFEPLRPLAEAIEAATSYAEHPDGWLVLHGPPGVGKTHLAAAIGNALGGLGEPVAMQVVPALLREMRRCFADADAGDRGGSRRFHDLFDGVLSVPLLILDDLGAEYGTKWAIEQTFLVVEERYRRRLPLVVTTNTFQALEPRVRSRLTDDGLAVVVAINAPDYRQTPVKFRRGGAR